MEIPPLDKGQEVPKMSPLEIANRRAISNCHSFDELYNVIEIMREIKGSRKTYTFEELKLQLEQLRHGHEDLSYVTNTFSLREKVEQLLVDDSMYKKYVLNKKEK